MAAAKKSKKTKTKRLIIPVYEQALVVSNDTQDMIKTVKRQYKYDLTDDATSMGTCSGWVMTLDNPEFASVTILYAEDLQTLVHESVHAAWRILTYLGVEVDEDNHEALAYLVDYIYGQAVKELTF